MFADEPMINEVAIPTVAYEKNSSFTAVIEFFEKYLPQFADAGIVKREDSEKSLVQKLVRNLGKYLQNYPFRFDKEGLQKADKGHDKSVDIDVISYQPVTIDLLTYTNEEPFYSFEAKVLGVSQIKRKKEYLIGHDVNGRYTECGGIERFKTGSHGGKLVASGMIAFLIKDTFENWFTNINNWIAEFAKNINLPKGCKCTNWSTDEQLKEQEIDPAHNKIRKYFSEHTREVKNPMPNKIPLTHFWISLI